MSSPNYHSTVIGHRRPHHKPQDLNPIIQNKPTAYHSQGLVTQSPNTQALTVPGGKPNTGYVNIPVNEQQRQNEIRYAQELQEHRNSFARHFYDLEFATRNIKPWQWGVGAGAITAAGGIIFVDGVAAGITAGIARLSAGAATATAGEAAGGSAGGAVVAKKIIVSDWGSLQQNWYRLWHLLDHAEGLGNPLKSKFPMGTDILKIISEAEQALPILQGNGNLARFINVQGIGTVTVITDSYNRLVTLFPGFSFGK